MYELIKSFILKIVKVPPEPEDPMGDVESLRVFRASYNFYRYKFYFWLVGNLVFLSIAVVVTGLLLFGAFSWSESGPLGVILLFLLALVVVAAYLVHTLVSYVMLRLDYEMRWYKVSDRSLRIREGVIFVKEMTMMFANIQNISVSRGPIQRLFNIADLKVESAGGGGTHNPAAGQENQGGDMHVAYFRGVDNAQEISTLMRKRLKTLKDSGLGDQDDDSEATTQELDASATPKNIETASLTPLLEGVKQEAASLRQALESVPSANG